MSSQLMVKEKELTKLKGDNKLLVKQFGDRKEKRRRETIPQVCYYLLYWSAVLDHLVAISTAID